MDLWCMELTAADPAFMLRCINESGIELLSIVWESDLSVTFQVHRRDLKILRQLTKKKGATLKIKGQNDLHRIFKRLLIRPVLIFGLLFLSILTLYLPTRVYFVEIEGNTTLPDRLILEKAEECGISFGVNRRLVRSEQMKNKLLQAVPELQWAGINTYGCRAVISVKERTEEQSDQTDKRVCSIVAARDGVIQEITVRQGNRVCTTGQAVKAGQVLISGYTDCGICIRATRADGEVYAETRRAMTVVIPLALVKKGDVTRQETKFSLCIGKKQINFSKDSGISTATCDKMYSVYPVILPGGLEVPVSVVKETVLYYDTAEAAVDEAQTEQWIKQYADRYLTAAMTAGRILQKQEAIDWTDDRCCLRGEYACLEMIGKTRFEESLENYGQTD